MEELFEKIEEIRFSLTTLRENTHKQPFFAAPSPYEILENLSLFMKNELDSLIQSADRALEIIETLE